MNIIIDMCTFCKICMFNIFKGFFLLIPCKPLSELTSSSVTNEFPFLLVELQAIDDCDLMETVCGSTKKRARESLSNTEKPKRRKKTGTNTTYF